MEDGDEIYIGQAGSYSNFCNRRASAFMAANLNFRPLLPFPI